MLPNSVPISRIPVTAAYISYLMGDEKINAFLKNGFERYSVGEVVGWLKEEFGVGQEAAIKLISTYMESENLRPD